MALKAASTVVLHRGGRVFLVERSPRVSFFPSVFAFPGGKVDEADRTGASGDLEAFRRAAVRELAEETNLSVDAARLVAAGRVLTPPFGPLRFDTQFFGVELAPGEEPSVVEGELVSGRWIAPGDAVAAYERGEIPLAPPTLAVLRLLRDEPFDAAARRMAAADGAPHDRRFRIEVHPGVLTLPLATRTLPPATTTNAVVFAGERVLVVDPGPADPAALEPLVRLLRSLEAEGRAIRHVAATHHHLDHVGGVATVAREFGAEVVAHAETARRVAFRVDRELADGDVLDLGVHAPSGRRWSVRAIHTPGHAPGHLAFLDERWGFLAAGDLVSGVSTIVVDPGEGDMAAYMASLARVAPLARAGILPAHGPPSAGARLAERTLEHRRAREALVLDAVERGRSTPVDMLPVAYADTDPALHPLAELSLRAHLEKLVREGKVLLVDGRYAAARAP